jgi:SAM-dependent methyltransferase
MAADEFDTHREPDEVFLPLGSERYCRFYDLEMAHFRDDLPFYLKHATLPGSVLELGCGAGRLCRLLAGAGAEVTGIDLNLSMLRRARQKSGDNIRYLCMDMTAPALSPSCRQFDNVVIPYHTLNLLLTEERIRQCLHQIGPLLHQNGRLLMQIAVPDQTILALGAKKLFQFQIFEQQDGGRIIKEIRRGYSHEDQQLVLEERYRVRQPGAHNEDFSHTLRLAAFPFHKWQSLLGNAGFTIRRHYGGYQFAPFIAGNHSCLFIHAEKC